MIEQLETAFDTIFRIFMLLAQLIRHRLPPLEQHQHLCQFYFFISHIKHRIESTITKKNLPVKLCKFFGSSPSANDDRIEKRRSDHVTRSSLNEIKLIYSISRHRLETLQNIFRTRRGYLFFAKSKNFFWGFSGAKIHQKKTSIFNVVVIRRWCNGTSQSILSSRWISFSSLIASMSARESIKCKEEEVESWEFAVLDWR